MATPRAEEATRNHHAFAKLTPPASTSTNRSAMYANVCTPQDAWPRPYAPPGESEAVRSSTNPLAEGVKFGLLFLAISRRSSYSSHKFDQ